MPQMSNTFATVYEMIRTEMFTCIKLDTNALKNRQNNKEKKRKKIVYVKLLLVESDSVNSTSDNFRISYTM